MKSENAKEYITHATCTAQEYAERFGGRELVVSRWDVSTAIELAEEEAYEQIRAKAIEEHKNAVSSATSAMANVQIRQLNAVNMTASIWMNLSKN